MSLPSTIGLPEEMQHLLGYSLPQDAKSFAVKIQPSNLSQISTTLSGFSGGGAAAGTIIQPDQPFPSSSVIFDLPCSGSPSLFLYNRFTIYNSN